MSFEINAGVGASTESGRIHEQWLANLHDLNDIFDFSMADRLRSRGWQVSAYSMPPNRSDLVVQRILVRHGFSRDLAELLLDDFRRALNYFAQLPVVTPLAEHEAGGHNHTGRYTKKYGTARISSKKTSERWLGNGALPADSLHFKLTTMDCSEVS